MKIFRHIVLLLTVIFCLGCVKETMPKDQNITATVQYGVYVDAPTRAMGDGMTANYVWYALYRGNGTLVNVYAPAKIDADRKAICPVTMVKNQDYFVVFVAMYFDNDVTTGLKSAYPIDAASHLLTMPETALANSDKYDLFYGIDKVTDFQGTQITNVTLDRKVAQVNFELSESALNGSGFTLTADCQSSMSISNVPATLDLLSGKSSGNGTVTYEKAVIPFEAGCNRIGTAYCLASEEGVQYAEVSINLYGPDGSTVLKSVSAASVPVVVNKRTNLVIN